MLGKLQPVKPVFQWKWQEEIYQIILLTVGRNLSQIAPGMLSLYQLRTAKMKLNHILETKRAVTLLRLILVISYQSRKVVRSMLQEEADLFTRGDGDIGVL